MTQNFDLTFDLCLISLLIGSVVFGALVARRTGYLASTLFALALGVHLSLRSSSTLLVIVGTVLTLGALQLLAIFVQESTAALPTDSEEHFGNVSGELAEILLQSLRALESSSVASGAGAKGDDILFMSHAHLVRLNRHVGDQDRHGGQSDFTGNISAPPFFYSAFERARISELIALHAAAAASLYELRLLRPFEETNDERTSAAAQKVAALRVFIGETAPHLVGLRGLPAENTSAPTVSVGPGSPPESFMGV